MAGKSVGREEDDVDEHDQRTQADAEFAVEVESAKNVIPEEAQENDCEIEKVAVDVLQDEGEGRLAAVAPPLLLRNGAGGRVPEEGPVVRLAVVVAGCPET